MKKLIKLSSEHYVVFDDSDKKEGDYCLMFDDFGNLFLGNEPRQYLGESHGHYLNKGLRKVTHSTKPVEQYYSSSDGTVPFVYHKIQQLNLSEVEELVNGYSVEKMGKEAYLKHSLKDDEFSLDEQIQRIRAFNVGYIEGFKAHQELTKDKLFTIEDIDMAYIQGRTDESIPGNKKKMREDYLKSLLPKSEWLVDFDENGKLKLV